MARQLLPSDAELAGLTDLPAVIHWVGLADAVWNQCSSSLGTIPDMRVMAMTPPGTISSVVAGLRLPVLDTAGRPRMDDQGQPLERPLSMVESVQFSLVWRVCRVAYQLPDYDIYAPVAPSPAASAFTGPVSVGTKGPSTARKVKVSSVADQLDDTELEIIERNKLDEAFAHFRARMGSDPLKESEPTPEQVTVLYNKVVVQAGVP